MKITKIIILFAFACMFTSCEIRDINVGIPSNIEFQELSKKSIKLKIFLPIDNANDFSFKIKGIDLDLFINEKNIGKINKIDKLKIEANSKNSYPVYFELDPQNALNKVLYLYSELQQGNPRLEVEGYIKVSKMGISRKIKIKHKQNISF